MVYCKKCILPDTRPNLRILDDGICNACHSFSLKPKNESFNKNFLDVVKYAKQKKSLWDCVIPVSGGKDSTWQVLKALEYDLKPLCITWRTPARTLLGQENLDNLVKLGVDHIDFTINPEIEKKFTLETFKKMGSVAIPMHFAIYSVPLKFATQFNIPLVIYGENSALEYGGDSGFGSIITKQWLLKYGVTQGTTIEDWISKKLKSEDLDMYKYPTDEILRESGVKAVFLGNYFNWDPNQTHEIAKSVGFKSLNKESLTGIYKFADVDDSFIIPIHHWLKWYKFGFTRTWDNLSLEIRNNRISRNNALKKIEKIGTEFPIGPIEMFCKWTNISLEQFFKIADKFRNKEIWSYDEGKWKIKEFLFKNWDWK